METDRKETHGWRHEAVVLKSSVDLGEEERGTSRVRIVQKGMDFS